MDLRPARYFGVFDHPTGILSAIRTPRYQETCCSRKHSYNGFHLGHEDVSTKRIHIFHISRIMIPIRHFSLSSWFIASMSFFKFFNRYFITSFKRRFVTGSFSKLKNYAMRAALLIFESNKPLDAGRPERACEIIDNEPDHQGLTTTCRHRAFSVYVPRCHAQSYGAGWHPARCPPPSLDF